MDGHENGLWADGGRPSPLVLDPDPLTQAAVHNALLRRLPPDDYARLRPHLTRVTLEVEDVIADAGEPIGAVCFLEGGVAGFLDVLSDGRRIAVGLVGRDGFVGWPLLMGNDRWPYDARLRATRTTALRVDAGRISDLVASSSASRDLLLRYAGVFMAQMGRTIVSNLIHPVERRAARWLLLYHDRVDGDEIALTHEELGVMLGVRRTSVTDAFHLLEGRGLIRCRRGRVLIRDRAGLEHWAGDAYGSAEAEYERLIARQDGRPHAAA